MLGEGVDTEFAGGVAECIGEADRALGATCSAGRSLLAFVEGGLRDRLLLLRHNDRPGGAGVVTEELAGSMRDKTKSRGKADRTLGATCGHIRVEDVHRAGLLPRVERCGNGDGGPQGGDDGLGDHGEDGTDEKEAVKTMTRTKERQKGN